MSFTTVDRESWIGSTLIDPHDNKLGTIDELYFDLETDQPQWMLVKTGLFGTKRSLVPLTDARVTEGGIMTPFDKRQIDDAPRIGPTDDLPDDQVHELYRHYNLVYDAPVDADRTMVEPDSHTTMTHDTTTRFA